MLLFQAVLPKQHWPCRCCRYARCARGLQCRPPHPPGVCPACRACRTVWACVSVTVNGILVAPHEHFDGVLLWGGPGNTTPSLHSILFQYGALPLLRLLGGCHVSHQRARLLAPCLSGFLSQSMACWCRPGWIAAMHIHAARLSPPLLSLQRMRARAPRPGDPAQRTHAWRCGARRCAHMRACRRCRYPSSSVNDRIRQLSDPRAPPRPGAAVPAVAHSHVPCILQGLPRFAYKVRKVPVAVGAACARLGGPASCPMTQRT